MATSATSTTGIWIDGTSANDKLTGTSGNDYLRGFAGNDLLQGGPGDDLLDGGSGHNGLYGGAGNDFYVISGRDDFVVDTDGIDRGVIYSNWYKTNPDVENWSWANGVQKLPYWIDALTFAAAPQIAYRLGAGNTIQYCFALSPASFFNAEDKQGFTPFNAAQASYAKQLFAYIETQLDVHFVETTDPYAANTIVLGNNTQADSGGYAVMLSSNNGSVVMIASNPHMLAPEADDGAAFLSILTHEVGHALGLKHPFAHPEAGGDVGDGPYLPASEDYTGLTVMSYTDGAQGTPSGFSPFDIAALQYLYGPARSLHAGGSVYDISDTSSAIAIADGAGIDLLDGSALQQSLTLYLESGYWSHVGAKTATFAEPGQITINFGTVIEDAIGGAGNDLIVGNAAWNYIDGGAGDDTLDGAAGSDALVGGDGSDHLSGGSGDDWFVGGNGDDALDGGSGIDTAVYDGARAAFSATRSGDGWLIAGALGRDSLAGVERISFNDSALALDLDGTAGQAYRLYATYDRAPDLSGLGYWIGRMDGGTSLVDVATEFTMSEEFTRIYGANRSADSFLTDVYQNFLHRAPDQVGYDFWLGAMHSGVSEGQVLVQFSESVENKAQVIGAIDHGIAYAVFG